MLRFQGLALRAFVLLSLFSTGCCCIPASTCGTGCGPAAFMGHHACSNGCGEVYVGEWYNHPPQVDPCNTCGDYVGSCGHHGCGEQACVPLLHRLSCLWGIRYVDHSCDAGCTSCDSGGMVHESHLSHSGHSGCSSCSGGHSHAHAAHSQSHDGQVIYDGPVRNSPAPKAAPTPAKPAPASPEAAPSVAPMPETGTTTRSTSPALRKKSSIQQASAQQAIRRR
jgi:hypothetical protein